MTLKILTVDDSRTIRMIVKKAFKSYDCEIVEAENGAEGLSLAVANKPDLIVLDITMPVMTGVEMLGKLKSDNNLKNVPVIMLTAESGKDNVMQIIKMGVSNYIVKPFKGEQLIERAEKIVKLELKKEDVSVKYFSDDGKFKILTLPDKVTRPISVEIESTLAGKIEELQGSGSKGVILDLTKVAEINVSLVKLIVIIIEAFGKASLKVQAVGTPNIAKELKELQETSRLTVHSNLADAKAVL